jgi:hypothetical protein
MSQYINPNGDNYSLFESVKGEIKAFSNIAGILEKINYDENFGILSKAFFDIFDFETVYAFSGGVKRIEKAEGDKPID